MATNLSFQRIATVPTSGLVVGRIYFETSTGMIKVATSATAFDKFGDGVKSASWDESAKTLKIINESGEEISLNLSDVASASAVTTKLAKKLNIGVSSDAAGTQSYYGLKKDITAAQTAATTALNAVKATAEAAAPKATTYTKEEVDNKVASAVGSVYKMKGSVDDVAALTALTGVVIGDVYNVVAAGTLNEEAFEAGSNFVAIKAGAGTQTGMWDKLGGTIDLSAYATKTAVTSEINTKIGTLDKADTAVTGQVVSAVSETDGIITVSRRALVVADIPTLDTSKISGLDTALKGKVPTTRTVNSKPLSANVVLAGADILVGGDGTYGEDDLQTAIKAMDSRITSVAASGVQSFGGQTGAITVDTANTTDGQVKFSMSSKQLKGTVNGLKSAAYTESSAYATSAQGTKADSALQQANIATGSANGTISVKGTDVPVKGLNSAAYVATSAFDTAGAATTALNSAKDYANGLMTWAEFE